MEDDRTTLAREKLDAIPAYSMKYFKLPQKTCHQIDKIQRDFIWGSTSEKQKIHYLCWDKITKAKNHGGLGLRIIHIIFRE